MKTMKTIDDSFDQEQQQFARQAVAYASRALCFGSYDRAPLARRNMTCPECGTEDVAVLMFLGGKPTNRHGYLAAHTPIKKGK